MALWCSAAAAAAGSLNNWAEGADFLTFYAAGDLTLEGRAEDTYEPLALRAHEQTITDEPNGVRPWNYPPAMQVILAPLALLQYHPAFALWLGIGVAAYLAVAWRIVRDGTWLWLLMLSGGVLVSVATAQGSLLIAAAAGAGLLLMQRRPLVGGLVLGLLTLKPTMGVLLPAACLATRNWRSIAGAILAAAVLWLGALGLAGGTAYEGWWRDLRTPVEYLESGVWDRHKMPTVTAAILDIGAPVAVARASQLVAVVAVLGVTAAVWGRGNVPYRVKCAIVLLATLLATPYAYHYDFAIVNLGVLFLVAEAGDTGWRRGEKWVLAAVWIAPFFMLFTAVPVGPPVLVAATAVAVGRAFAVSSPKESRPIFREVGAPVG